MIEIYRTVTFVTGFGSWLLGAFVYIKDTGKRLNRSWFIFCLSVGIWCIGYAITMLPTLSKEFALFSSRLSHASGAFIPVFFVHFVYIWMELTEIDKKILRYCYILCSILFVLSLTPFVVVDLVPKMIFKYYPVGKIGYFIYVVNFIWWVIYAHYFLFKRYGELSGYRRSQMQYLLVGTTLGFFGGATCFPLIFNIKIIPYPTVLIFIYITTTTYAILRYRLMDIEVIIKKSVVFAGMFTFILGVVVAVAMAVAQLLGGANNLLTFTISALIITFTLRPLETFLINSTDKFLFQKKYEYKQILRAFIDEVITVLNLDEVVNSTLKLLDQALHPYTASIFILNKMDDKYQLYNAFGIEDKEINLSSESKLVFHLKKSNSPAVIKQINGIIGVNPEVALEMGNLKAVLVLPLKLHDDLIGFIALGRKKSDEDYTRDDLDVLLDLARTESIAVGNAQLLQEAAQAERRAAIGTMSAGINHEIGNPLNIMSTKIQMFKLSRGKGLFKDRPSEEVLDAAEETLDECLKQSGRISEITKKLSNFAKPSKEFKPQLVNIPEEIEETLSMVGHDLELEKIKVEKSISFDLYKILADKREMQQIFFNLIRNAGQAIEATGKISISAVNTLNNKVHIEIQDTGRGIPEDKVHRIFEPFFTTKGPNKGTGLGLSIVRQLVWKNKGEISFRTQVGAGTTFILEFPKGA